MLPPQILWEQLPPAYQYAKVDHIMRSKSSARWLQNTLWVAYRQHHLAGMFPPLVCKDVIVLEVTHLFSLLFVYFDASRYTADSKSKT